VGRSIGTVADLPFLISVEYVLSGNVILSAILHWSVPMQQIIPPDDVGTLTTSAGEVGFYVDSWSDSQTCNVLPSTILPYVSGDVTWYLYSSSGFLSVGGLSPASQELLAVPA